VRSSASLISTKYASMDYEVLALSTATIRRAQDAISSCESCNSEAEFPFDWVLDEVTGRDGSTTDYFLTEPAHCPRCGRSVIEKTLVEPYGGVYSF
jgi:hypothetical protein